MRPEGPMHNKEDLTKKIGRRVRELRKDSGLTQKRVAEATGLSPGLLSRIENGLVMPSIPTLQTTANVLNVDIGYFFRDEDERKFVVTLPGHRRSVVSTSGRHGHPAYELELLAENMNNPFMEPAIVTYVGDDSQVAPRTHDGQEFMYVLQGKVKLTLGTREYTLTRGHAAYWNGSTPHKAVALGNKTARSLHVHLIPGKWTGTFRYDSLHRRTQKAKDGKKD